LKYALYLEDDEKFLEAEEEFIKANKPKEAIDMYVHEQDWPNALRVAENFDPVSVSDVYIAHARVLSDKGHLKQAEELYISAARPELALAMYQEAELWQDALKLAQLHLPHRVAEVTMSFQSNQAKSGKGGNKKDFLTTARAFEQNKQWAQAIDAYLAARKDVIDSVSDLEDLWDRAIELARNYVPNRYVEVALDVSRRLIALGREETAADILFEINRQDEALSVCINAKKFDKAKALAQGNPVYKKRVDEALQGFLVQEESTGQLVELGRADKALEVLAKKGDWGRLWEVAASQKLAPSAIQNFVVMRCDQVSVML
jgi:intraflagellar transport protein 172